MAFSWRHLLIGLFVLTISSALIAVVVILTRSFVVKDLHSHLVWGYECRQSKCMKVPLDENNFQKAVSMPVCRIFCGDTIGTLWPKPTGPVKFGEYIVHIDRSKIVFEAPKTKASKLWAANEKRFAEQIESKIPDSKDVRDEGRSLKVKINVDESPEKADRIPQLTYDTDESYKLEIRQGKNEVYADISAKSYFGARHGLETLSQLIVYDDIRREVQMLAQASITDKPAYKHRGLLLDTSRNYFSVKSIKRTLDGMAMTKLNTFHWHITDSHSFPLEIKSQPELFKLGAYSARKVYTHENVADIVEYGRVRGIRVLPEFDAPAHVGEGWQNKNMTACFNAQPWKSYCVEPPCGQLDPTVDELYNVLEDIYREMFELFNPDVFHMGGDEVSTACWNTSEVIRNWMLAKGWGLDEKDFMKLWGHFQDQALARVDDISSNGKLPIIMWTSRLTEVPFIDQYLDKDRYIIQVWTTGFDMKIKEILKRGYKMILSNYDALYFDCGFAGWVTDGNNWCSPYIGWQKVYENSPEKIAGDYNELILGAEAAIWSEQIDEQTVDAKFWPRASALAERLWSNPKDNWRAAESRLLVHRERLTENGLAAEAIEPEWCLQNQNECPIDAYDAKNESSG
ncbi:chitooligosaccharidolytic beta-N-acetylglucosaminidase isoform X1 [Episyrphus balteatus]|uniref:chitooligosaccharidolytic beta-N-acetylglucosaminidase isoform X1 n=1 Tax=Episyrphus balteatus TaxID=286459 RepID=UPI002486ACB5|nr:chitooligosaccharidolytic beta-N-acetylglucosaminidase isoform X1 [Episyrphus balteatus]